MRPGDLVVADEIGVTVVPTADFEEVYVKAKELAENEEATRAMIAEGWSVQQLLEKFGRI